MRKTFNLVDHCRTLRLGQWPTFFFAQGKYGEAEELYKRSLDIRERVLGADHSDVAASLNNLAGLFHCQVRVYSSCGHGEHSTLASANGVELGELVLLDTHIEAPSFVEGNSSRHKIQWGCLGHRRM